MKTSHTWVVPNKNRTKQLVINWLYRCMDWYWDKVNPKAPYGGVVWLKPKPPIKMHLLVWCYYYGWKKGYITTTFDFFKDVILNELHPGEYLYPKKRKERKERKKLRKGSLLWLHRHGGLVSTKYQKKKGVLHGIKNPEQVNAKRLWQEATGKNRDHNKPGYKRGPGKFYKKIRSKKHRAWIKRNLYHENYEVFNKSERNCFIDRWWDWD